MEDVLGLAAELDAAIPAPKGEESAKDLHDAYERDIAQLGDDPGIVIRPQRPVGGLQHQHRLLLTFP